MQSVRGPLGHTAVEKRQMAEGRIDSPQRRCFGFDATVSLDSRRPYDLRPRTRPTYEVEPLSATKSGVAGDARDRVEERQMFSSRRHAGEARRSRRLALSASPSLSLKVAPDGQPSVHQEQAVA